MTIIAGILVLAASMDAGVRVHADAILASQLPDGAIVHARAGEEVSIVPYFGNKAAAGLYEAYRVTKDQRYLDAANAWVDWCLDRMDSKGRIPEYRGSEDAYHAVSSGGDLTGTATFLYCANLRRILTKDRYFLLREQSKLWNAYEAIAGAVQPDGLLFASDDAEYKLTFHNAEAYESLYHARQIARSLRDHSWNSEIYYARRGMEQAFERMRVENGLYAWGKTRENFVLWPEDASAFNTVGLANVAAVAYGPASERDAKKTLREVRALFPDLEACSAAQLFLWSAAGCRVDDRSLAKQAVRILDERSMANATPADHGYQIRTMILADEGEARRFGVPMGSTYMAFQRPAVR
jgi:hypothetical protein